MGLALSGNRLFISQHFGPAIRVLQGGQVTTLAGNSAFSEKSEGYIDGSFASARFASPSHLAIDQSGNLFVADWGNNAIRLVSPDGSVTTLVASPVAAAVDGPADVARFSGVRSIALAGGGLLFSDGNNQRIRLVRLQAGN